MKRYLDDSFFKRFIQDFQFLFKLIRNSHGELDLRLRDNYFNIYYRGNSMMKVNFRKKGYQVVIHKKFAEGVFDQDNRFLEVLHTVKRLKGYHIYNIGPELLHSFLQQKNLKRLASNVKKVNHSEEITFEQTLITDNMNREDYLVIDRQVTEKGMGGLRMDLLGLRQGEGNTYAFEVIEVKLGNSNELKRDVGLQLDRYISRIKANNADWKQNYEKVYRQLKQTEVFDKPSIEAINILPEVSGRVVVIGYSGIAKKNIKILKQNHPDIIVNQMEHLL